MAAQGDEVKPGRLLAAITLTVAAAASGAALLLLPKAGQPVAVIAPLGNPERLMTVIAQSGGAFAGLRGTRIALATPGGPDFLSRLRRAGYWLVLDARAVAFCRTTTLPDGGFIDR